MEASQTTLLDITRSLDNASAEQLLEVLEAYAGNEDQLAAQLAGTLEAEWVQRFLGLCEQAEKAQFCVDVLHKSLQQTETPESLTNASDATKLIASYKPPLPPARHVSAASDSLQSAVHWQELTTAEERAQLPPKVFDAITLPEYQRVHWPRLFAAHLEAFAQALGDSEFRVGDMPAALSSEFQRLRREQMRYLGGRPKDDKRVASGISAKLARKHDRNKEAHCRVWIVYATLNGEPYGAIFVFYEPNSRSIWMQGISVFDLPAYYKASGGSVRLPRLNDILLPGVNRLAYELGARQILVDPINRQKEILKARGFQPITDQKFQRYCKFFPVPGALSALVLPDVPAKRIELPLRLTDVIAAGFRNPGSAKDALAAGVQRVEIVTLDTSPKNYDIRIWFVGPKEKLALAEENVQQVQTKDMVNIRTLPAEYNDALVIVQVQLKAVDDEGLTTVTRRIRDYERRQGPKIDYEEVSGVNDEAVTILSQDDVELLQAAQALTQASFDPSKKRALDPTGATQSASKRR